MKDDGFFLIRESTNEQIEYLNENTQTGKNLYIEGPFISTNLKNRNGRVYPKALIEEVVDKYQNLYINENRAVGELYHPDYPLPNFKKAALKVESLEWRGDLVYGRAKVLTKMDEGKILQNLIEEGIKLGVSTRGMGKLKADRFTVAAYNMNAIDAVDMPSGQPCYFDAINESVIWVPSDNGAWNLVDSNGEVINEAKTDDEKSTIDYNLFLENFEKVLHKKVYG